MSFILNPHRFGAAADPGLTLLQSATLWLDASDDIANAQWKRNKGTGGRSLDARQGSVGSAQIVKGALKLPGATGNSASTPDAAALDITGDIDLIARAALIDWTPSADNALVGKWGSTTTLQSYLLYIDGATGRLAYAQANGLGAYTISTATTAHGITDGSVKWVRATRQQSGGNIKFYTSDDGSAWTQLGTTVVETTTTAIHSGTGSLMVGNHNSGTAGLNGSVFRAIVRNGYDGAGSVVFDADFTAVSDLATSFVESSSNAATVTINSTTGVDTNDPLLLTHTGTNYLYLPGVAGNYTNSPGIAAYNISGNADVVCRVSFPDWTPSSSPTMVQIGNAYPNYQFGLYLNTTGTLGFGRRISGSDLTYTSSAPVAATDGDVVWVRALFVQNDGGVSSVTFYTSPDGSAWTQLGTKQTNGSTAATATGTYPLRVGSNSSVEGLGLFYRVQVWSGDSTSGGTKVFDADFTANTNQSSFTESSSNAATVTINRATSGRKSVMVTRPVWLFGTDDYMEIADNALLDFAAGESMTAMLVMRQWGSTVNFAVRLDKSLTGGTSVGWSLFNDGTTAFNNASVADGSTQSFNTVNKVAYTTGTAFLASMVRNVPSDNVIAYTGTTAGGTATDPTTGTIASTAPLAIGRANNGGSYTDMEVVAVAVFRSALTSTELGQIATYYGV